MNKVRDSFAILYFLASVDGSIDERELQIIVDFTNRQHGQLNFDPCQTIADLARLTGEARIAAYDRALFDFRDNSSVEDRYTLMNFAADLAAADGAISQNEKILFQDMAKVWGVDTQTLFEQSRSFVQSTAAPPVSPGRAAIPAHILEKEANRSYFFAWSLGSRLSQFALATASLNLSLAAEHLEKASKAAVITLEEKIKYFESGKPDLSALGGYRGFITVVNAETNGIFLIKEFSEEMRIAAPIFTAPDSADRFLANLPPEKRSALKQTTINGDTLLNDLPNMKI